MFPEFRCSLFRLNALVGMFQLSQIPDGGIEISLDVPTHQRKKKKGFDVEAYLKREMARVQRDIQVLLLIQWDPNTGTEQYSIGQINFSCRLVQTKIAEFM